MFHVNKNSFICLLIACGSNKQEQERKTTSFAYHNIPTQHILKTQTMKSLLFQCNVSCGMLGGRRLLQLWKKGWNTWADTL